MSFIDQVDLPSRSRKTLTSYQSSRRGTEYQHRGTTLRRSGFSVASKLKVRDRAGSNISGLTGKSHKVDPSLQKQDIIKEEEVKDQNLNLNLGVPYVEPLIDEEYEVELLEQKNTCKNIFMLMMMGISSFTRGYYMMIYNPMGLDWLKGEYQMEPEEKRVLWLSFYNFVWMFGAYLGTHLGQWLFAKVGPRWSLFIFQSLRIPVTLIYQIPDFYVHVVNRFLCGILVGCQVFAVPKYIKQVAPENLRSFGNIFANCAAIFGGIVVGLMAVIMGDKLMAEQWKILLTAPGFIPVIQLPCQIYFNIDSPSWILDRFAKKSESQPGMITKEFTGRASSNDHGRQLDNDLEFEDKYKFTIEQKHLDRLQNDFKKVYTPESAELAYETLLLEHKEKLYEEQITMKKVMSSNPPKSVNGYKYLFFLCMMQNILTRLTGANFFQFYAVFSLKELGHDGNWCFFALVWSAFAALLIYIFIVDLVGRKFLMQIGALIQCICMVIMAVGAYEDWMEPVFIPQVCLFILAFSIGMEGSGIMFTNEMLPPCAVSWAMYSQWLAGCLLCFTNYLSYKTSQQFVYIIFACVCFASLIFMGLFFRETKDKSDEEIRDSYKKKVQFKLCQ